MTYLPFPRAWGYLLPSSLLFLLLLPLSLSLLCITATAHGQQIQYITAPEVKNMMENDPRAVVINALSRIEFDGLHITGSINIPVIDLRTSTLLPADRTYPLIFYCMGPD
jgi:hypothetical protein